MAEAGMVMYEEEFKHVDAELSKLHQQVNAKSHSWWIKTVN